MAVVLSVTKGPATGKVFTFSEHDTFLSGRMSDCHATFPNDTQVSRHHFILEACPPKAVLRDLGSLNGTYVNGKNCGGRKAGESPEQGAKRQYPAVDLADLHITILVNLYAKAKKSDLSRSEENDLRSLSAEIRRAFDARKP